jgi:hypothetical protein
MDIYRGEGSCLSPLSFGGWATRVDLWTDVSGAGATRVMSESESDQDAGEIISGAEFDFAEPNGSALTGNNTLTEEYDVQNPYKGVSVELAYVNFKVYLKDKYVTVLIPTYDQPFGDFAMEACGFDSDVASQDRYEDANLLDDMEFKRGDFLFCVKDAETDECTADDYQWLDTDSDTLVSTRPDNPKVSHHLANIDVECSNDGDDRYGFNFKSISFVASLAEDSQFKLWGDYSHGSMSNQWPNATSPLGEGGDSEEEPYVIYYYTSADDEEEVGSELVMEFDFDSSDTVFIEDLRASDVTTATLGEVLAKVHLKSQWAYDEKSADDVEGGYTDHYAGMTATVNVTLSGGTDAPKDEDEL